MTSAGPQIIQETNITAEGGDGSLSACKSLVIYLHFHQNENLLKFSHRRKLEDVLTKSHMRRTLARENFTSARRRHAISLSMLKVPNKSTRPKRPRAFICFSVFGTPDKTLALVVDILLQTHMHQGVEDKKQFKSCNNKIVVTWKFKKQLTLVFQGQDRPALKEKLFKLVQDKPEMITYLLANLLVQDNAEMITDLPNESTSHHITNDGADSGADYSFKCL